MSEPVTQPFGWDIPPSPSRDMSIAAAEEWRRVNEEVRAYAIEKRLTQADIARMANVSPNTLHQILRGTYIGKYDKMVDALRIWLAAEREQRPTEQALIAPPSWVETPIAMQVRDALIYAQVAPAMVMVSLGSGMGKTTVSNHVLATRPNTYRIVVRKSIRTADKIVSELARILWIEERAAGRRSAAIGARLKRNGRQTLLLIDEAQHLLDEAVDELRYFFDEYGLGIALLGNDAITQIGRVPNRDGYGQLHRRFGVKIRQLRPSAEDIAAFVAAWQIEDAEINALLHAIGRAPGSLGQITETMKHAAIIAAGAKMPLSVQHVRQAWQGRDGGMK